jgi:uracil-DNA glycosylase
MTESYESLWEEIHLCDICKNDERIEPGIRNGWKQGAFFPRRAVDPEPPDLPVRYLLVAQEPSAGRTKGNMDVAQKKIASGLKNFNCNGGDFAIRWAACNWLVNSGEAFLLTDLAKCAVTLDDAIMTRSQRYHNCRRFLNREVHSFRLRVIVAVGKDAYRWCRQAMESDWPPVRWVTHHLYRFPRPRADNEGLPTEAEFDKFVKERNPTSRARLHERELNILSVYKRQFAEIKAEFGGDDR